MHSDPQADLLQAFLHTEYRVLPRTEAVVVVIGNRHPRLDEIIEQRNWAILTGFNPGGRIDDPDANDRRQQQLLATIADAGLDFLPACNSDPAGHWPDEPSLLVIGAEPDWLKTLARRLGQLALVAGQSGDIAELWLLDGEWPDSLPPYVRRMHR